MKILLINDYGSPMGGAEVLTLALRDALNQEGHDARLFASSAGTSTHARQAEYECFGTVSRLRTLLQTVNPWAFFRLRRVLHEFQPDVVHVRMFLTQLSPIILPLLRRVPSLYHVVWYRPACPTGTKLLPSGERCLEPAGPACYRNRCVPWQDWILLQTQMWLWRRWRHVFMRVVANSRAVQECLMAEGIEPVEVIHNGVDVRPLTRTMSATPLAVFAGRLVTEKGVDVLLRAFAITARRLPEARLLVAGDGPLHAQLVGLAAALGLGPNVVFLGHLRPEEMEKRFASAWVQVVPSRWAEPFGLVAVEAMMRRTAVVGSSTGGLTEIIEEGRTGFMVPPNDPEALAEKLTILLRDRAMADAMGRSGRELAEQRFNLTRQSRQFQALYRQMTSEAASLCPEPQKEAAAAMRRSA